MSESPRAWKIGRSIQIALIFGGITGLLAIGMTYNKFVGDLEPGQSLLVGAGVAVLLTAILTYVFDQISRTAQNIMRAARGNKGRDGARPEKKG